MGNDDEQQRQAQLIREFEERDRRTAELAAEILKQRGAEFEKQAAISGVDDPQRQKLIAGAMAEISAENQNRPGFIFVRDERGLIDAAAQRVDKAEQLAHPQAQQTEIGKIPEPVPAPGQQGEAEIKSTPLPFRRSAPGIGRYDELRNTNFRDPQELPATPDLQGGPEPHSGYNKSHAKEAGEPQPEEGAQVAHAADDVTAPLERGMAGAENLATRILDGVAEVVEDAIHAIADTMASLLGGGSAAPSPKQQPKEPPPLTAKERHEARLQAFVQADQQQRQAARQETARRLGASDAMNEQDLRYEQEAQEKRGRSGGISR